MTHLSSPWGVAPLVMRWAERSQQRACRNAMVASTALAQARHERDEVEAYVAGALARRTSDASTAASAGASIGLPQQPGAATGS